MHNFITEDERSQNIHYAYECMGRIVPPRRDDLDRIKIFSGCTKISKTGRTMNNSGMTWLRRCGSSMSNVFDCFLWLVIFVILYVV
jgi:hypothetical protein